MPELNLGTTQEEPQVKVNNESIAVDTPSTENINQPVNVEVVSNGMSAEELKDYNKIKVTIADYNTPLVILFGPPACGKTMTLVRLTRYLKKNGYEVKPITSFRPAYDTYYTEICTNFNTMINSDEAADSTPKIHFMLVQVLKNGKPLCQILEAPGELYFKPEEPQLPFPRYINAIIATKNRKIWAIMLEPDNTNKRMDVEARRNYVTKIHNMKTRLSPRDKIMFIFNKIDETPFVINPGNIKYSLALQHTDYLYPNIFVPFKNQNPITSFFSPYNFDFITFQTGTFSDAADGTKTYEEGNDVYPRKLWETISNRLR